MRMLIELMPRPSEKRTAIIPSSSLLTLRSPHAAAAPSIRFWKRLSRSLMKKSSL